MGNWFRICGVLLFFLIDIFWFGDAIFDFEEFLFRFFQKLIFFRGFWLRSCDLCGGFWVSSK